MIVKACIDNLNELKRLLISISNQEYNSTIVFLDYASIGAHTRHIIEFYEIIINKSDSKIIDYSNRKRNLSIAKDIEICLKEINTIIEALEKNNKDKDLIIQSEFGSIKSSLYRELWYCFEHSIHHQALIKVGLKELKLDNLVDEKFGVAPSTIKYRESQTT